MIHKYFHNQLLKELCNKGKMKNALIPGREQGMLQSIVGYRCNENCSDFESYCTDFDVVLGGIDK